MVIRYVFFVLMLATFSFAVSCGDNLVSDTNLTANLNSTGNCLKVNANNIVIDCKGYSITGDGTGNGITVYQDNNITIKNCVVGFFAKGIAHTSSSNNTYVNNTFYNNTNSINVLYGTSNKIINNTFDNASSSLTVGGTHNNKLVSNVFSNNNQGLTLTTNAMNNLVFNNQFFFNNKGIYITNANDNEIVNNSIQNNVQGIHIFSSSNTLVTNNTIVGNQKGLVSTVNFVRVFNNYFNNTNQDTTNNFDIYSSYSGSQFNTTKINGTNIIGGSYLGGNYYAQYNGTDLNNDGIGDVAFDGLYMFANDSLPLVYPSEVLSVDVHVVDRAMTTSVLPGSGFCAFTTGASETSSFIWGNPTYTYPSEFSNIYSQNSVVNCSGSVINNTNRAHIFHIIENTGNTNIDVTVHVDAVNGNQSMNTSCAFYTGYNDPDPSSGCSDGVRSSNPNVEPRLFIMALPASLVNNSLIDTVETVSDVNDSSPSTNLYYTVDINGTGQFIVQNLSWQDDRDEVAVGFGYVIPGDAFTGFRSMTIQYVAQAN